MLAETFIHQTFKIMDYKHCVTEYGLHRIVEESIQKELKESVEVPEVHFCKRYSPRMNETRFYVLCEYGNSIVAGCFDIDNTTNKLIFVSVFESAPYNVQTMVADEDKMHKLSQEESDYIAKEILRTGQTSDCEDMRWYRRTEGVFRMIPR